MSRTLYTKAYLFKGDKILLGKKRENRAWVCMGGKIYPSESVTEGIIRTVKKDIGFRPDMIYPRFSNSPLHAHRDLPLPVSIYESLEEDEKIVIEVVGKIKEGKHVNVDNEKFSDYGFFNMEDIDNNSFIPIDVREKAVRAHKMI